MMRPTTVLIAKPRSILDSLATKSEEHRSKIEREKHIELRDKFVIPILCELLDCDLTTHVNRLSVVNIAYSIAELALKRREQNI